MSFRAQIVSGLRWSAGARFAGQLVTRCITIVVIRLLNPSDYGLLALAGLVVGFVALLADAGLGPAVVQAAEMDEQGLRKVFGLVLLVDVGLFLLLFLSAPAAASFFGEPKLSAVIRLQAVELLIRAFSAIPDSRLQRALDFKRRSLVDLGSVVSGSVITLGLAVAGLGVWALVWGNLAAATLRSVGLNLVSPIGQRPSFDFSGLRGLALFGRDWTFAQLLWFFHSQADVFVAGKLLGKDLLGTYSIAMQLASLPVQRATAIVNQVTFPVFARLQDNRLVVRQQLIRGVRLLSILSFPVLWGISSIAPEIVSVFLGATWQAAIFPMQIIALAMPLTIVGGIVNTVVQSVGRGDVVVRNAATSSALMPAAFVLGSQWGLPGLSLAWLLPYPLVFAINMRRVMHIMDSKLSELASAMWRPASAALAMYATVAATRFLFELDGLWALGTLIPIGAIAYCAAMLLIDRDSYRFVLNALSG